MILKLRILLGIIVLMVIVSCNNGPKVISSDSNKNSEKKSGVFSDKSSTETNTISTESLNGDMHQVEVLEILETTKYIYLKVVENGDQFWIATLKQKIDIGGTYFYKGGLLKTNFESKEHNKIFDKIYLVTSLVQANHGNENRNKKIKASENQQKDKINLATNNLKNNQKTGSIKIAELLADLDKFNGKIVQLSGKCVKINPNIMGRNWIHLKDGSKDDFDLVITSDTFVKEGSEITIKATVSLNKDFGAGYKYDVILENGVILP